MDQKTEAKWKKQWNHWVAKTEEPGIYRLKKGGLLVRARAKRPDGTLQPIKKVLPDADLAAAREWLQQEKARIRAGGAASVPNQKTRFSKFAASHFKAKVTMREIKSARSRERWAVTLEHLIEGTQGVRGFGDMYIEDIRPPHILNWKMGISRLIAQELYAPTTCNGWWSIFCVIMRAAKRELGLPTDPTDGIRGFDTSEHETYSEEQPNALPPERVGEFLEAMRSEFPQYYAMTYLGFATGPRPSSMRPLRRSGPTPDVRWDEGVILVRRSHSLGDEVMNTTKTNLRQRIHVPAEVMAVLRWHVETQLKTPEQQASELLFPAQDGGYLNEHCLREPFRIVGELIGLPFRFTPRGMRRTFNDLARVANVESLVTRSISGHATEQMRAHYSTVQPTEQRASIGRMLQLVKKTTADDDAPPRGPSGGPTGSGGPTPSRDRLH
ncbi:MAG TPA: site-specific integrase [Candidatus Margulisiibacteriota bacterium]|nr:site-specific integrase [Candidatus Margulisiibacteriota bacterium]